MSAMLSHQLEVALVEKDEKLSPEDRESIRKYGVYWRTTSSGHTIGIDPKSGKAKYGNPHVVGKGKGRIPRGALKGGALASKAVVRGAKRGYKRAAGEHGHDSFWNKLKGKAKGVADAFRKLPEKTKKLYTDPEHRKKTFSKKTLVKGSKSVGEFAGRVAAQTWKHIKHEGHNAKVAGQALWRVRNTDVKDIKKTWNDLSDEERKAVKGAIKAAAMTIGGTAAMGHFGAVALAKHFLAESLAIGTVMADEYIDGDLLTEEEKAEEGQRILREAIKETVRKLDRFANASNEEAAEVFAQLASKDDDAGP